LIKVKRSNRLMGAYPKASFAARFRRSDYLTQPHEIND
jgi:hypothetical protein